ncbi:MAG: ASCH domain-containing protein [Planctomycetaceae bacterium]
MVAYNFQAQFTEAIASGAKTHTIRRNGKRRHARAGERLQLYTGMRTKACRKILQEDPVCDGVYPVVIVVEDERIAAITVGGAAVDSLEQFAIDDGFESLAHMHEFWIRFHGVGRFVGSMIEWKRDGDH